MLTAVVAFSTVFYVVLTGKFVSETRQLRKVQTEPRVSVRLELADRAGHGAMELVIRNEGQSPAQDIQFNFRGDPTYFTRNGKRRPIDDLPIIRVVVLT